MNVAKDILDFAKRLSSENYWEWSRRTVEGGGQDTSPYFFSTSSNLPK